MDQYDGVDALIKKRQQRAPPIPTPRLCHIKTQPEGGHLQAGGQSFPELGHAGTLIWGSQPL